MCLGTFFFAPLLGALTRGEGGRKLYGSRLKASIGSIEFFYGVCRIESNRREFGVEDETDEKRGKGENKKGGDGPRRRMEKEELPYYSLSGLV